MTVVRGAYGKGKGQLPTRSQVKMFLVLPRGAHIGRRCLLDNLAPCWFPGSQNVPQRQPFRVTWAHSTALLGGTSSISSLRRGFHGGILGLDLLKLP